MNELKENKEILELLETLEKNGLQKEKTEVSALVDYIGEMEQSLSSMLTEMKEMRKEVNLIHDNTLRAKCEALVQGADQKIRQGISMVVKAKENFVISAKNALDTFKEKGKEALKKAVNAMKIPEALDKMGGIFEKMASSLREGVVNLQGALEEYSFAKEHRTNARSLLFGKKPSKAATAKNDRGILAKMIGTYSKLARGFSALQNGAYKLADKIRVGRVKSSVKADLAFLKSEVGNDMPMPSKNLAR